MAVSISVIENKIRITTAESDVDATITKFLIVDGVLSQESIEVIENIVSYSETSELEDGVYQIDTNDSDDETNIAFIVDAIEEQQFLLEIDTIKTKPRTIQIDYRNYYNLISFSIHYDNLLSAITNFNNNVTIPFTNIEIVKYFDNITNYFKQ